ncbi:MAG: hypothetical protein OM95_14665 [Bdellovibrio sp. ArHS]|uniref:hypothetical protein n=1 Tax=Bdellovibrio sp. ArHS TaxID=1569284 RepID=UPI0005829179|nr:hypothetical protein [Bdellovibrio sp. ArHS]KHD87423.1 MAG: hypothetical protein OM95_14665 [Bdellovibrio sp. ArHS]
MANKSVKKNYLKRRGRPAKKVNLSDERKTLFLEHFKYSLWDSCKRHIKGYLYRQKLEQECIKKCIAMTDEFDRLLEPLSPPQRKRIRSQFRISKVKGAQSAASDLQPMKQRKTGRPPRLGEISYLIYSALEGAKGDKNLINEVGRVIKAGGELHTLLRDAFPGIDAYELFNFPSVHISQVKPWHESYKFKLKARAKEYFKNLWREPYMKEHFGPYSDELFEQMANDGGFSQRHSNFFRVQSGGKAIEFIEE